MAPNLIIERHRRDVRTRQKPSKNANCHFHGKVRGHNASRVALSTCKGLVGHIKTNHNEYFIEPSKHHEAHPVKGHPHVVFQRTSVKDKQHNNSNNNKKRKHRRKKGGHKKQRNHLLNHNHHHHSVSNCGTREPRRRIETRLEWQPQGKFKIQGGRKIRRHQQQSTQMGSNLEKPKNKKMKQPTVEEKEKQQQQQDKQLSLQKSQTKFKYKLAESMAQGINNQGKEKRTKRSISTPRHVETLIVADSTMVAFHVDVQTYLLTIMNMVSSLYKDPSIGNSIEIVVVKILLLDDDGELYPELNLTQNAQQNLNRFCGWQHKLNTENEIDAHHHDVAILITRKNICGNNCMTLGLANVGGMCNPKQSCSVNEDNGIMLSHTIAHELGHNFGMFHDSAKIGCHPRNGPIVHIMTPTFGADTLQVSWSNCSRKYITNFLDQGLGECLDDRPQPFIKYPKLPPGVRYNAEVQCRLQYNMTDSNVSTCSSMHEICSTLWCMVNGECITNMRPTAPGTSCGERKWCQNGKCVRRAEIKTIDGGWGNWSEWSECSRSCGGGVSIQQRECDSPLPRNGGLFCIGERKRYKICNTDRCPINEPNFRAKQCAKYNNVTYQGGTYKWLPHFEKDNPCKLFCTDVDDTIIANWGETVLDGTPCTLGTNNMCIDGICKKVGCDWIVDSDLQEDRCGICGGQDDQCKPVKDIYAEDFNITEGYLEILTIPARARHIVIRELGNAAHFLGIARANSSEFYLNGDSLISMPGEFVIAGAESLYERLDEQETLHIPQPIERAIALYVIVRGSEPNAGIYYEFTLPVLNTSSSQHYEWRLSDWTSCTKSCGGGLQYREPMCYENGKLITADELCWTNAINTRPTRQSRQCNSNDCPAYWWTGPWQFCQDTCRRKDSQPQRKRSVMCLGHNDVVIEDLHCNATTKPKEIDKCEEELPECDNLEADIEAENESWHDAQLLHFEHL